MEEKFRIRQSWTKDEVLQAIRERFEAKKPLNYMSVVAEDEALTGAARRYFGSWGKALEAAGFNYDEIKKAARANSVVLPPGSWSAEVIIAEIRKRANAGLSLAAHVTQKEDSRLYAASVYTFGSWGKAVEAAGYDYLEHRKTGTWTKSEIIERIKKAYTAGADLSDSNVQSLAPGLYGAAVAAFGSWPKAVEAAGLPYDEVSRTVRWSRAKVITLIVEAAKTGRPLSSRSFPRSFVDAATELFGSWEKALEAAGYGEKPWYNADARVKNRIREFRLAAGLSEEELGARVGVSHRTISLLELGQYIDPRVSFAIKVARALGHTVEEVFEVGGA